MATILDLLAALNRGELPPVPAPATPMPLGPLTPEGPTNFEFAPELPPEAPPEALDRGLIERFISQAGTAPTPPAPRGRLERIANALMGFSAGVAGQGPQFLAQLAAPQRQYEADLARFNERRADLGLRGTIAAEDKAERRRLAQQRIAEKQADREFQLWVRRLNLSDAEATRKAREAFELEKEGRARAETERKEAAQRKAQQEDDARGIAGRLGTGPGAASPEIAKELGRYYANLTDDLSPTARKWLNAQAQRAQILASRAVSSGGTGATSGNAASLERQFNALKARFLRAEQGDATPGQLDRIAAQFPVVMEKLAKLGYEVGFDPSGVYPYIKPPQGQQPPLYPGSSPEYSNLPPGIGAPTPQGKTITRAEMKALGVTDKEVKAEGYTILP